MSGLDADEPRIVQAAEIHVIKCLCGNPACRHCGFRYEAHEVPRCPSCGCPRALPMHPPSLADDRRPEGTE